MRTFVDVAQFFVPFKPDLMIESVTGFYSLDDFDIEQVEAAHAKAEKHMCALTNAVNRNHPKYQEVRGVVCGMAFSRCPLKATQQLTLTIQRIEEILGVKAREVEEV